MDSTREHSSDIGEPSGRTIDIEAPGGNPTLALAIAVARNQAEQVPRLIRGGANVLHQDCSGFTPFARACDSGQIEIVVAIVEALLALDASSIIQALLTTASMGGEMPLMAAARNGHLEVVIYLIELESDIHYKTDEGLDALLVAAMFGHSRVIQYLLAFGADVESTDLNGATPLHYASGYGHTDVVDILLDHGARVNQLDLSHQSALHRCAVGGHAEVASRLICAGGNATVQDDKGSTAFLLACQYGDREFVNAMIQALIDMGQVDALASVLAAAEREGFTPLSVASRHGFSGVVELLIARGADRLDLSSRDANNGATPLMHASAEGHLDLVRGLIEANAEVNLVDRNGCSALWHAANGGHCGVIKFLLDAGAEIDLAQVNGITPLMVAVVKGFEEIVDLLVRRKANVHLRDQHGFAALAAAGSSSARMIHILLEAGSDPKQQFNLPIGGSILIDAANSSNPSFVEALINHGANIDEQGDKGVTGLMLAAGRGHTSTCEVLLKHGAKTELQDSSGRSALHFAVERGNIDTVRILVRSGIDVNIEDNNGMTALQRAAFEGRFEMVELLESAPGNRAFSATDSCGVWPVHALLEFYDRFDAVHSDLKVNPPWYVDASEIEEYPGAERYTHPHAVISEGTWMGSNVTLVRPDLHNPICECPPARQKYCVKMGFVQAVDTWMPLRHPHVLKLYGACHRGPPLLVVEHAQGTLRSYLLEHPDKVWSTLHQAALGLQYLHERGVYHGHLHGDIIKFSNDGMPKICGLDPFTRTNVKDDLRLRWLPSEGLKGEVMTPEVDMHSFGMCIIEAVSGDVPYAAEVALGANVSDLLGNNRLPVRHKGFCDRAWELVKSLCGCTYERISIGTLVEELETLVDEHSQKQTANPSGKSLVTLDDISARLDSACALDQLHPDRMQANLLAKLKRIVVSVTQNDEPDLSHSFLRRCFALVDRFALHLEGRRLLDEPQRHSSSRQHGKKMMSLHVDLERLLDEQQSTLRTTFRAWRGEWSRWLATEQQLFSEELENVSRSQDVETQAEQLSCMLFEITKHRNYYGTISHEVTRNATIKIINILGGPLPEWFFPWYEVALATSKPFSKGGFGEVYRGKWMGSDVVVKKCIAFDQKVFVREVELWFKLDHPHVVKLFGACHVGQKFFVAEWAEHGQLDTYLARNKKLGRSVMWQKLHEAALGLRYLHVRGIIHRDLKCNNILVGRDETAKITDFGLSSPSEQSDDVVVTQTFGNARWAAPEVLAGGMPSYASDVFSFGMSIVEAVTGRVPYAETRDRSVVAASVAAGDFLVRPRCFERDDHWTLVTRCCAFDPAERVDMDEVIATLSTFADEEVHRHHNEILLGSKSESVVREPETILESTKEESMLVSKASRRDSQGAPANDLSTILTSMREVGEVDIAPESPDLFISDASRRESHALEAGDHESSHGWSAMSHIYEAQSSMAEVEEDGLSGATVYYSAWSHDEKPKARDVDSNASTASTSTASTSLDSPSASGA